MTMRTEHLLVYIYVLNLTIYFKLNISKICRKSHKNIKITWFRANGPILNYSGFVIRYCLTLFLNRIMLQS